MGSATQITAVVDRLDPLCIDIEAQRGLLGFGARIRRGERPGPVNKLDLWQALMVDTWVFLRYCFLLENLLCLVGGDAVACSRKALRNG